MRQQLCRDIGAVETGHDQDVGGAAEPAERVELAHQPLVESDVCAHLAIIFEAGAALVEQRHGIAHALAVDPEVLLLDEPCSALDPVTTAKIEELMFQLKDSCTMIIVTHNMQQAARASDFTAFLLDGKLIEHSETPKLFTTPSDPRTEAYITGRFG